MPSIGRGALLMIMFSTEQTEFQSQPSLPLTADNDSKPDAAFVQTIRLRYSDFGVRANVMDLNQRGGLP